MSKLARLSGRGKREENKGRERAKRRRGGGEGRRGPLPQYTLRSMIYFGAFPLQSLFTGYVKVFSVFLLVLVNVICDGLIKVKLC